MPDRSMALLAQVERVRTVEELHTHGFSTIQAWALMRWRQKRKETRVQRQQVPRSYRPHHRYHYLDWGEILDVLPVLIIMGAVVGIVGGLVSLFIVTHAPKALGRLGF